MDTEEQIRLAIEHSMEDQNIRLHELTPAQKEILTDFLELTDAAPHDGLKYLQSNRFDKELALDAFWKDNPVLCFFILFIYLFIYFLLCNVRLSSLTLCVLCELAIAICRKRIVRLVQANIHTHTHTHTQTQNAMLCHVPKQ